jgi:hypothetical protein
MMVLARTLLAVIFVFAQQAGPALPAMQTSMNAQLALIPVFPIRVLAETQLDLTRALATQVLPDLSAP